MFLLIYESVPRFALSQDVLREIAESSRARNAAKGITGILMMADQTIVQVIEGEEADVHALYAHIEKDMRHKKCRILLSRHGDERLFPDWSLGFSEVGSERAKEVLDLVAKLRSADVPAAEDARLCA